LDGKHALITGASDGIGKELAKNLVGICRKLTLVARRKEKLEETADELSSLDTTTRIETNSLDICDIDGMIKFVKRIYETDHDCVDSFINCAGGSHVYGLLEEMTHEDIDEIFYTNGAAPIHWLRELLPRMKDNSADEKNAKRAHVLMMSSRSAERPLPRLSVYSAAKKSVEVLVDSLRQEYARYGIVFTLINPGSVRTSFASQWNDKDRETHNAQSMSVEEAVYPILHALNTQFAVNRISYESVIQWREEPGVLR